MTGQPTGQEVTQIAAFSRSAAVHPAQGAAAPGNPPQEGRALLGGRPEANHRARPRPCEADFNPSGVAADA